MREKIKELRKYLKENFDYMKHRHSLPLNPQHDDVYIVEFPKSGITWLSFIIGNIYIDLEQREHLESITFYNHHYYVADVHQLRKANVSNNMNRRFLKSHATFNPYYYFIVYLIRNPFDVMVSYYNFMVGHGLEIEFDDFVKSNKFGIKQWVNHVNGWLNKGMDEQRIHLLKYEDLKQDTFKEIKNLYKNLGITVSDETVSKALEKSEMNSMRESEDHYRKHNPNYIISFVGKKDKRKKDELLNENIKQYIRLHSKEILDKYYPTLAI